jgi:predicted component of type VI protein secretion system
VLTRLQLRQAVLRDLTALLNTTPGWHAAGLGVRPGWWRVRRSIPGMDGFAGMIDAPSRVVAL